MIGLPLTMDACLDYLRYTTSIQKLTLRFFYFCIPFFSHFLRAQPEEIVSVEMSINDREGNIKFLVSLVCSHCKGIRHCSSVNDLFFALSLLSQNHDLVVIPYGFQL